MARAQAKLNQPLSAGKDKPPREALATRRDGREPKAKLNRVGWRGQAAEGSASDEADTARAQSEAEPKVGRRGQAAEGSASDEADEREPKPEAQPRSGREEDKPPREALATRRTWREPKAKLNRVGWRGQAAEGSASDEADAARAQSEAEPRRWRGQAAEGSASDEADAARAQSEAEGEPAVLRSEVEERAAGGAGDVQRSSGEHSVVALGEPESVPACVVDGVVSEHLVAPEGQGRLGDRPGVDGPW